MDAKTKTVWLSKTWWVSLSLASVCEFHPSLKAWVDQHGHTVMLSTICVYLFLRHFTNTALQYRTSQ